MARETVKNVIERSNRAWTTREEWDSTYRDAYDLAQPMRNLHNVGTKGDMKMDRVFDSTLLRSGVRFANKMQARMTPPFQKWAIFEPGLDWTGDARVERQRKLQIIRDQVFAGLHISNFDTASHEGYLDLGIGTLAIMVHKGSDRNPFRFTAVPQTQIALEEGGKVDIGAVYRKHKMKRRMIEATWGGMKSFNKVGSWDAWVKDDPDKEVTVVEATYMGDTPDVWYFDVILPAQADLSATSTEAMRIVEEDFKRNPWIIARWIKVTGEVHGRGPILYALPDAKTLNKVVELLLRNAALSISGVWTARDDGTLNPYKVRITPGAIIPVGSNATGGAGGPSLLLHKMGEHFNLAQILLADLRESVRETMMDKGLPAEDSGVRSASEFVARVNEGEEDTGSPYARTFREWITPVMQQCVNILAELGQIKGDVPKFDGYDTTIKITSRVAQLQNLRDIQNLNDGLSILNASVGPQGMALGVKMEKLPEFVWEKLGIDAELLRSPQERAKLELEAGQQQQAQEILDGLQASGNGAEQAQAVTGGV